MYAHQSGKVPGIKAPLNSNSSEMPGKQLSHNKSGPVSGVSTYTLWKVCVNVAVITRM